MRQALKRTVSHELVDEPADSLSIIVSGESMGSLFIATALDSYRPCAVRGPLGSRGVLAHRA
ncbi:hypothetical protein BVU17_17405 [Haloarcula taiwanensis]|uniref:Uncharacterized protein n=1 Tax=Haloarcula taiwanensis TaxID=1932004 RepID=A0A2H5A3M0_9EURY|nr:hypothetical protein BVU17_17405 [Haloarcula taiwanensis]RLM34704.1 hypothetical protein DVK01_13565 [Haloarcula sp. Atlit-120R]